MAFQGKRKKISLYLNYITISNNQNKRVDLIIMMWFDRLGLKSRPTTGVDRKSWELHCLSSVEVVWVFKGSFVAGLEIERVRGMGSNSFLLS